MSASNRVSTLLTYARTASRTWVVVIGCFRLGSFRGLIQFARRCVGYRLPALDAIKPGVLLGYLLLLPARGFCAVLDAGKRVHELIRRGWWGLACAPRQQAC